jgi:hypothetical protein
MKMSEHEKATEAELQWARDILVAHGYVPASSAKDVYVPASAAKADHHQSAKALIIKAAEQSGLLEQVAEFLWFTRILAEGAVCCSGGTCPPCELLQQLTAAFGEHVCMAGTVAEDKGRVSPVSPEDKAEAAAFIGGMSNE